MEHLQDLVESGPEGAELDRPVHDFDRGAASDRNDRTESRVVQVLIADDDPGIRLLLAALIGSDPLLALAGSAHTADQAIELARTHTPDVALIDVEMPGGGVKATREIAACSPRTQVVAFSGHEDRASVLEMVGAGASGYLVKGASSEDILEAIRGAADRQANPSTDVTESVIDDVARQLRQDDLEVRRQLEKGHRIARALNGNGNTLWMVFQPIAELTTGRVVGVEALARFASKPYRTPDAWFRDAAAAGLLVELELAAARAALTHLDRLPAGVSMWLNVSPATAMAEAFHELIADVAGERLVIEITEHARVVDYDALLAALTKLRKRGVRLAVDDAGAGFATLRHILRLAPDAIKLDVALTRNIDRDQARRALASALIAFAAETGASMVAEGIETEAEAKTLRALRVSFGQGYHLARPGPLSSVLSSHVPTPL
ncbi:MAG: EAL domain-containing protein [Actinomycetota bacterium]